LAEARVSIQVRVWTQARAAIPAAGRVWTPARAAIPAAVAIRASPAVAQAWIQGEQVVAAASEAEARALFEDAQLEAAVACGARALAVMPEQAGIPERALTLERVGRVADGLQAAARVAAQPPERCDRPPGETPEPGENLQPAERERNAHRSPDGSRLRFAGGRGSGWQTGRDSASPPARWNAGQVRVRRGARCGPQAALASGDSSIRRGRR
jgi:hypothetical protein